MRIPPIRFAAALFLISVLHITGCTELEKTKTDSYFAGTAASRKNELRWSNGKFPRSLDPARAAAPPETDVVRAIFEGLTELDPRTLLERPAAAEYWTASDDFREWTFEIRPTAKWSNGEPLTANDFLRSWKRAALLGKAAPYRGLFSNIVGLGSGSGEIQSDDRALTDPHIAATGSRMAVTAGGQDRRPVQAVSSDVPSSISSDLNASNSRPSFGIAVRGDRILVVTLKEPDREFPRLLSHPIFRPVHREEKGIGTSDRPTVATITNGAFKIASVSENGLVVERSEHYWDHDRIRLERVKFVPAESTEKALEAYRAGELDLITNAGFSPVLLKLLSPYEDFRKTTFAAINLYEFNFENPPFSDRRVRQALSMAIERERLSEGELEGSTVPAMTFMPFGLSSASDLIQDKRRARDLLDEAGYPNGTNFPAVRLVINRNDTQQRIARSVAAMWSEVLNIRTEIIVRESSEMDDVKATGDFDLIRRGVVLSTPDELANVKSIFGANSGPWRTISPSDAATGALDKGAPLEPGDEDPDTSILRSPLPKNELVLLSTHEQALHELRAIPLYFPTSYSLVKPFVVGFETNSLDAPLLLDVYIDETWQPQQP